MRRFFPILLLLAGSMAAAQPSSFHVRMPNAKGKESKADLTFDDHEKSIRLTPARQNPVVIPYNQIEKCSYEYTTERTIALTEAKTHFLEIEYHDQDMLKKIVVQMSKHDAVPIQDALKAHTGIEAEVVGNADKRHGK